MSPRIRLLLFVVLGVVAAAAGGFALTSDQASVFIKQAGVYVIATWFAVWIACGWWLLRPRWGEMRAGGREWWRERWLPVAAVLAASLFVVTREPFAFKVTMDELALASTSMSLHYGRVAAATVRAYELQGVFQDFGNYLDKRPLLFPFLGSLVHDLTGYRVANLFALNAGLTVALFALVYRTGRWLRDRRTGLMAVLLVASLPLLAQNATGAGFELLNVVMLLAAVLAGARYVREPRPATQALFIFTVILLANSRYESALFVASAGAVIVGEWLLRRRIFIAWPMWVAPFAFVPVLWHMRVFSGTAEFWQLPPGETSPFALKFFYENTGHFLFYLLDLRGTSSPVLAVSSAFGLGFAVLYATRYWARRPGADAEKLVWWAFLGGMVFNLGVLLCYHWGQVDKYEVSRLLLPWFVLGGLAGAWALGEFSRRVGVWRSATVVVLASIYAFTLPVSARAIASRANFMARRMEWTWEFHQQLPTGRYFFFTPGPLMFVLHQVSALNINLAQSVPDRVRFHRERGTFDDVYVVQNIFIDPETGIETPIPGNDPGPAYKLERVAQRAFRPFVVTRISRVVDIDPAVPPVPAGQTSQNLTTDGRTLGSTEPGVEMRYDEAGYAKRWLDQLP